MFICKEDNHVNVVAPALTMKVEDRPSLFFKIVGEFTGRSWAQNYGGHPRSDVALLNEQSDLSHIESFISRLKERKSDGLDPSVSDSELSVTFRSKYCQTASEKIRYIENLLAHRDNIALSSIEASQREKAAAELKAQRDDLIATLTPDEKEYLRSKKRTKQIDELLND